MDTPPITYGLVEETYRLHDTTRVSYGIAAFADAGQDGTKTIVASARDLSSDRGRVMELIQRCNRMGLSPVHLPDVIDDTFG